MTNTPTLPDEYRPSEISPERAAQLLHWQREHERLARRTFVRRVLAMFAGSCLGMAVMWQAFRVTDRALGEALLSAGVAVGWIAIVAVLVHAWVREQNE